MIKNILPINKDIKLWHETFGEKNNPCILLIMGAGAQGIFWPDEFCLQLASEGYFVIRYDHRDIGLSTLIDFEKMPYDLNTLASDAIDLLNLLNIEKAHIIGTSMGGYITQLIALNYPKRLNSMTYIASSPDLSTLIDALDRKQEPKNPLNLPLPFQEILDLFQSTHQNPTSITEEALLEMESWRLLNNNPETFDEPFEMNLALAAHRRAKNYANSGNHLKAIRRTNFNTAKQLKSTNIPALIIHGDKDPILPLAHGQALANALPQAKFINIKPMGHLITPYFIDEILEPMIAHL